MRRREFIKVLAGAAAAWPLAARAQQSERVRRIGVLLPATATMRKGPLRGVPARAGRIGLDHRPQRAHRHPLGHDDCRRIRGTRRNWPRSRRTSSWPLPPDRGAVAAGDPHRADRVPGLDPVGAGVVESLARPGGNATGFICSQHRWEMAELLKEIAPGVTRVAVLRTSQCRRTRLEEAARTIGRRLSVAKARNDEPELNAAVALLLRRGSAACSLPQSSRYPTRSDHRVRGTKSFARRLPFRALLCRRPDLLWG